ISPVVCGTLSDSGAQLVVPSGGLQQATRVTVTRLSQQGLAGILPPGWSPITAADIEAPSIAFALPATLRLPIAAGYPAGVAIALARWDDAAAAWRVVSIGTVPPITEASLVADVSAPGQYVWLLADTVPAAPPQAVVGELVSGVAAAFIPT